MFSDLMVAEDTLVEDCDTGIAIPERIMLVKVRALFVLVATLWVVDGAVVASASENEISNHSSRSSFTFGRAGQAAQVDRTITISLHDNFYEPEDITVKSGETVRFFLKNEGSFVHEFSLATQADHLAHQPHMQMMMEHGAIEPDRINHALMQGGHGMGHSMVHDRPNGVLLEPGKSAELIWTFAASAGVEFACTIPGHYDSGMVGSLTIGR